MLPIICPVSTENFPALSKIRCLADRFASCENIVSRRSHALFLPPPPPLGLSIVVYPSILSLISYYGIQSTVISPTNLLSMQLLCNKEIVHYNFNSSFCSRTALLLQSISGLRASLDMLNKQDEPRYNNRSPLV